MQQPQLWNLCSAVELWSSGFGDILAFRVGLVYVQLPCLLLGGGKSRMAGTAPSPTLLQAQVPGISLGSHTASPVLPSAPSQTLFPERGHGHCFPAACNANEPGCPGAAPVPS